MMKKGYKKGGKLEMVKDPATGKMVPAYAVDGAGEGDMAKGKKGMKPEMKPKKKKKRSEAMDAVTGTGPAAPRKAMKMGGMAKKGYARGGMAQAPQDESTMKKGRNRRPLQPGPLPAEEPTRPSLPRKAMKMGGMAKKGYAKGGKVRGAGIARKGTRPCKMR